MNEIPRISKVKPLPLKHLEVIFTNSITKVYDCNPLLSRAEFSLLGNDAFFKAVQVDAGGYGISWNDDIDLSEHEVWTNGRLVGEQEGSNSNVDKTV
jgi:hypothetical protein